MRSRLGIGRPRKIRRTTRPATSTRASRSASGSPVAESSSSDGPNGSLPAAASRCGQYSGRVANENVEVARGYHERTKHSEERLRASPHHLDWENQPVPFKLYRDLETIPLPRQLEPGTVSALRAISALVGRETEPTEQVPGLQALARVLYYSAGITKVKRSPGGDVYFRAAANTGALYHVDLYLACRDLPDLPAGIYHFGAHDFALRRLRVGDYRGAFIEAAGVEPSLAQAPVVVASASTYWRNAWKYRDRAYRHAFWDGGTLHANLLAVAAAQGLAAKVVAGFADRDVEHLLGLDPAREGALALVPLGRTAEPPPPAPDAPVLNLETEPLSAREIDYPAIREIHSASSLEHGEEVARWRGVAPSASGTRSPERALSPSSARGGGLAGRAARERHSPPRLDASFRRLALAHLRGAFHCARRRDRLDSSGLHGRPGVEPARPLRDRTRGGGSAARCLLPPARGAGARAPQGRRVSGDRGPTRPLPRASGRCRGERLLPRGSRADPRPVRQSRLSGRSARGRNRRRPPLPRRLRTSFRRHRTHLPRRRGYGVLLPSRRREERDVPDGARPHRSTEPRSAERGHQVA